VLFRSRAGERHPQTVDDYFPVDAAPDPELAELLRRHRADEERHTRMYGALIEQLGGEVVDVDDADVFNHQIRRAGGATFAIHPEDDVDARRRKVGHFLLHAHFLERRIAQSVAWHAEACVAPVRPVVEQVQADEERHIGYTASWARQLLTTAEHAEAEEIHRRAEAVANLRFSARQCRVWVERHGHRADRRALYSACAFFMERMAG
jgi:hypothetical protein